MPRLEAPVLAKPDEFYPGMAIRPYEAGRAPRRRGDGRGGGHRVRRRRRVPASPGHIGYYADGALFSGDVLFAGSVGRTDLPFSDWDTLVESIRSLMAQFPPDTVVYSGHGPETTLGTELARNPFLAGSAPREVRGAAGHPRHPPVRAASLARAIGEAERLCALYGYRRIGSPAFEDTGSSRALRDRAPTWCRKEMYVRGPGRTLPDAATGGDGADRPRLPPARAAQGATAAEAVHGRPHVAIRGASARPLSRALGVGRSDRLR